MTVTTRCRTPRPACRAGPGGRTRPTPDQHTLYRPVDRIKRRHSDFVQPEIAVVCAPSSGFGSRTFARPAKSATNWPASGRLVVRMRASQPNQSPFVPVPPDASGRGRPHSSGPRRQQWLDNRQQQNGQSEDHAGFHDGGGRRFPRDRAARRTSRRSGRASGSAPNAWSRIRSPEIPAIVTMPLSHHAVDQEAGEIRQRAIHRNAHATAAPRRCRAVSE